MKTATTIRSASPGASHLGERAHLLLAADYFDQDAIWSLEALQSRPVVQAASAGH